MTATIHRHHHQRDWGLATPTSRDDWRDDAQCPNYPAAWWDLIGTYLTQENQQAIRICHRCPVQTPCDQLATTTHAIGVIMAGLPRYSNPGSEITWRSYACLHCQRIFTRPGNRDWRYCNPTCRQAHNDRLFRERNAAAVHPQAVDRSVDNAA